MTRTGGIVAAADTSSAEVVVVVDVGGMFGGKVVEVVEVVDVPVVGAPGCVVTVVVVGGELGVVTVVVEPPDGIVVLDVPLGVLSANDAPAKVVVASSVALTSQSLWNLIDILLEAGPRASRTAFRS